jgi:hypothetical protein
MGAIGNMYLHSREEVDAFNSTVILADELYSKAEELGLEDITLHIEAKQFGGNFGVEIKGTTAKAED